MPVRHRPRILFTEEHGAVMRSDGRDSGAVFHILHPEAGGNREYAFRISPVEQRQQTAALFIGTQKTIRIFIGFNHLKHGQRPVFHDSVEGGGKRFQTLFHTIIRLFLTLLHLKKRLASYCQMKEAINLSQMRGWDWLMNNYEKANRHIQAVARRNERY